MHNYRYQRLLLALHRRVLRLQRAINRLPARRLWIGSILFTVAVSTLLSTLLVFSWKHPSSYLSITSIHVPAHALSPPAAMRDSLRQQATLRHIHYLLYQVDSLRTHPATKYLYDSLVRQHPGLWDSLVQAQSFFLHPFNITP